MSEYSAKVLSQRRRTSLRSVGLCLLIPLAIGCDGGEDTGPIDSKTSTQTAPSKLEKDSKLSQPPKLAPPP